MGTVLKWLLRIFGVVVALALIGLGLGWYLVTRSIPDYDDKLELEGLDGPVYIIRDANAVPHIRAGTEHDAFFALGLVQAQDRLWQMMFLRRTVQGKLGIEAIATI